MEETPPSRKRLRLVIVGSVLIYGIMMLVLGSAWYSRQWIPGPFHFFDDLPEWKQMDKFAHFFWAFQVSALAARLLRWAGVSSMRAASFGSLMGFFFVSCIEIPDGFSNAYGASLYDVAANLLGAGTFLLQIRLWQDVKWWPKFSFHPSIFAPLRPEVLGNTWLEQILKDYNGQTFWYSITSDKLPLPSWLAIAVGVGAEGMIYGRDAENIAAHFTPGRRYFLSIDLNLKEFTPKSWLGRTLVYALNIIKIPAPTIEFSTNGIRFHPVYF
ncbi:MAG: DUF2279 domain-containing protein [Bacteroidetes bacterium]|nr:DUF2279 domain-containing protein [Bacteroidota bacterium]